MRDLRTLHGWKDPIYCDLSRILLCCLMGRCQSNRRQMRLGRWNAGWSGGGKDRKPLSLRGRCGGKSAAHGLKPLKSSKSLIPDDEGNTFSFSIAVK